MSIEEQLRRQINSRRILHELEQESEVRYDGRGRRILTEAYKPAEKLKFARPSIKRYRSTRD